MANQAGDWNLVGKPKKTKNQPSKSQKKNAQDNLPKFFDRDPLQDSSATMFDVFLAKERQRNAGKQGKFADKIEAGKEPNSKSISDGNQKKKSSAQKSKKQEVKKVSVEDAVKDLTEEELRSVLMQSKGHFPEKPELWLKDLVTFMNFKMENTVDNARHLRPDSKDYPASLISKGCTTLIKTALADTNKSTLEHMLSFCITSMLEEAQNGIASYGYKIFLLILARNHPEIVGAKLQQFKELVRSIQNRPDRCLMVLWALGQAGITNLKIGLRVWIELMVPYLNLRSIGGYCMQYVETLLNIHHKGLKSEADLIKMKEYFGLLDQAHGSSLPTDIQKRLLAVFPKLKTVAYGPNVNNVLLSFFPSYLVRATPDITPQLKTEVLSCLTECLVKEKRCFQLWCQLYLKYFVQTRVLLEYIHLNMSSVTKSLDKKLLQQTLMYFIRTNDESQSNKNAAELKAVTAICEDMLKKVTGPTFPWRLVMFFLITSVVGIVMYDLYSSKDITKSRTIGFLEAYGVLGFLKNVWDGICLYSNMIYSWLEVNVPIYYKKAYVIMEPYVTKLVEFGYHVEENTRDHRYALYEKVYGLSPHFWDEAYRLSLLCLDYILEYIYWISGYLSTMFGQVYQVVDDKVIHGNFTTENIHKMISWSATKVQTFTQTALDWCRSFLN